MPTTGEARNNQENSSCRYRPFSHLCKVTSSAKAGGVDTVEGKFHRGSDISAVMKDESVSGR